jgi:hypothetical protein
MNKKPTPTPQGQRTPTLIKDWNQLWGWANGKGLDFDTMAERQAFIVRAVNAHEELLANLKEITKRYANLEKIYAERTGMTYDALNGSITRAEQAIAGASGESHG